MRDEKFGWHAIWIYPLFAAWMIVQPITKWYFKGRKYLSNATYSKEIKRLQKLAGIRK